MKFGKLLKAQIEEAQPELVNKFLAYKDLKKHLKSIVAHIKSNKESAENDRAGSGSLSSTSEPIAQLSSDEREFVSALNEELDKFNNFFMEKEEDCVIHQKCITDRLKHAANQRGAESIPEYAELCSAFVKHHGEMVLLLNWSYLNYAALVKILKKHDKVTGLLLRSPYLANVMRQPFYSTEVLGSLVKQAEKGYRHVAEKLSELEAQQSSDTDVGGFGGDDRALLQVPAVPGNDPEGEVGADIDDVLKRTEAAIAAWTELRKKPEKDGGAGEGSDEVNGEEVSVAAPGPDAKRRRQA